MSEDNQHEREKAPHLRDAEVAPPVKTLPEILDALPTEPGVYIMKDARGKILYIGKAASLRVRVRQYFQPNTGDSRDFVPLLEGIVRDIETVLTSNEKEALLLENTLIKKHQPRFNVNLRDDKSYLVLKLDPSAEWPRLEVVRRMQDDGAQYFGPYHSATSCREALRVVNRHFQLRTCTDHVLHNRRRPCLQYQIKRCPAPCVLPVPREEYDDQVRDVGLFLAGKSDELLDRLRVRMKDAASRTEFERAATTRDQLRALEATLEAQRVVSSDFADQDVFGFHREGLALELAVIAIRDGKMVGSRGFSFTGQEFPDAEILSSFVGLYYDLAVAPPDEVLLPFAIEDAALKAEWLTEKRQHAGPPGARTKKVEVLTPQRGSRRDLIELARKNAAANFASRRNAREDAEEMLAKLQRRLKLHRLPRVIECYDISHIQGSDTVASMVVFVDGRPEKSRYRTFNIRSLRQSREARDAPDDFASMYEVLSRRFRRAREAEEKDEKDDSPWRLPDLIVVDGGKGQLAMALAAARDVGIDVRPGVGLPIVALAKESEAAARSPDAEAAVVPPSDEPPPPAEAASEPLAEATPEPPAQPTTEPPAETAPEVPPAETAPEPPVEPAPAVARAPRRKAAKPDKRPDRLFLPQAKDAIPIRPNSAEMFVLQQLRDEAHRFAVAFHRGQRRRRTLRSALSDIPGVGAARQRDLLRHFGSLKKIREASVEDLSAVEGLNRKTAEAVYAYFASRPEATTPATPDETPATGSDAEEDALESAFAEVEDDGDEPSR